MPSPFPGMDPYLEHPALWRDVHNRLVAELGNALGPILQPRYFVALEERTYLAEPEGLAFIGRPGLSVERRADRVREAEPSGAGPFATVVTVEVPVPDHVRETWLEVRTPADGQVVTVLELLSPTNKRPGRGRALYLEKRLAVLGCRTSLVEVDLVRVGDPMPFFGASELGDYRILVSRGERRPRAELWPFALRVPIPSFRLPLRPGDAEPEVELGRLLAALYDKAAYSLRIDYAAAPIPPIAPADAGWADGVLRAAGRRR